MTTRLRSIEPIQCGVVAAVIYLIIGIIEGLFLAAGISAAPKNPNGPPPSLMYVFAAAIPIAGAVLGFIGGVILALIYNLVARWTGGITLRFDAAPELVP